MNSRTLSRSWQEIVAEMPWQISLSCFIALYAPMLLLLFALIRRPVSFLATGSLATNTTKFNLEKSGIMPGPGVRQENER